MGLDVQPNPNNATKESFAETALRLGGKSADEASRTGKIDMADDQVEDMFAAKYQTSASPIHRAVWQRKVPIEQFGFPSTPMEKSIEAAMQQSVSLVKRRRQDGTLFNEQRKISDETLQELSKTGYWGMLIPREYGGLGSSFRDFTRLLTRMAAADPTVAGLASVHGCIGAVDPVRTFGNAEQKQRFLPSLADGSRLSGFALTEPGAGSDLTALRTTAVLRGDQYVVNGEKLFITNVTTGRTVGLVCLIDNKPAVLVVDLPEEENESFQLKKYGLYALKHTYNQGMLFKDFEVPADNLLQPAAGDGLTVAYHGLNLGRVSLCASAAGIMRMMLTNMLPWAAYRKTYGESIDRRELVRRRIGEMAGYIVACDALADWCANLLDLGFRGEMECIIAKIFGSEVQKTAAIELFMKTHGGRSFLHGHLFGDNVHEFLAPCIYEGEGEMLGMAFFKSLVKSHGKEFFEPIGRILFDAKIKAPNLANPRHAWMLRKPMAAYAKWWVGMKMMGRSKQDLSALPSSLSQHASAACNFLCDQGLEISTVMRTHQLKLADRQCSMTDLSQRLQDAVVILVTSLYGSKQKDPLTQQACEVLCAQLSRGLTGKRASNRDWRRVTELGGAIADNGWGELEGIEAQEILMKYPQST
ncbi:MAG: acyl-CoA/acyl-ACP dehydrogenase [Pirellulaceae bacterium]|jgi:alkylation response protein AidB-like acyl-CoA dehydrogenase|nr:acyl-CoA/acyl-ACP dehydrogenase [Pirellulaceae bacterium]